MWSGVPRFCCQPGAEKAVGQEVAGVSREKRGGGPLEVPRAESAVPPSAGADLAFDGPQWSAHLA